MVVLRFASVPLGALIVLVTTVNVTATLLVPRGARGPLSRGLEMLIENLFRTLTGRVHHWARRDMLLAGRAPVTIIAQLFTWLGLFAVGFSLMLAPVADPGEAVRESVSSMLTLGFTASQGFWATSVDALAAVTGLTTVALQLGYLPTLYGAYNRRETDITLLAVRAGDPPWGPELLARTHYGFHGGTLGDFYGAWERWAADIAESHQSYPILVHFRSPKPERSWVVGLLAVLDAAALHLAIAPKDAPVEARLALRMGFICFRSIARSRGITVDDDPRPDAELQLTRAEFDQAYERIEAVGFPVERTADEAWVHFRGWRVNYETAAYGLAEGLDVVPALWSGPRRSGEGPLVIKRPPNRTPESPEGQPRDARR